MLHLHVDLSQSSFFVRLFTVSSPASTCNILIFLLSFILFVQHTLTLPVRTVVLAPRSGLSHLQQHPYRLRLPLSEVVQPAVKPYER